MKQLKELLVEDIGSKRSWRVIHNSFNAEFAPVKSNKLLIEAGIKPGIPYILHVGSSLRRKNRKLLLHMVARLIKSWNGSICYAGEAIDKELIEEATQLGILEKIISVQNPNHATLVALYTSCHAFVFPSFSEGFGWPIIEAQACGAPVITSNIDPMPEISGGAALFADPYSPADFANAFLTLENNHKKLDIIQRGFENCRNYSQTTMIDSYIKLHGLK